MFLEPGKAVNYCYDRYKELINKKSNNIDDLVIIYDEKEIDTYDLDYGKFTGFLILVHEVIE